MLIESKTIRVTWRYWLVIALAGLVVLSSCVNSVLNTTGSISMTDSEAYDEIKTIAGKLENSGDPGAYEVLVEKSRAFIKVYPKDERVDEVYYLLGVSLIQLGRTEKAIEVFDELILDQSMEPLETYIASEGLAWRQYLDSSGGIANMYNVRSIPSTFLIDGTGIIRQVNLRGSALEMAVAEMVRENMEN